MATFKYTHNTADYTSKDELLELVSMAKYQLQEDGVDPEVIKSAFDDIDRALRISVEVRNNGGKLLRVDPVTEEIELELDIKDTFDTIFSNEYDEAITEVFDFMNDEDIIDKADELRPPVKAIDMNDYNFKRWLCDVFETGYHVEDWHLIKSVAVRLDKAWEVM